MRLMLSIIIALMSLNCVAKDNTKDFIKLIKKHDVPYVARELPRSLETSAFWSSVLEDNPIITNLYHDISKKKGAEKEALMAISRMKNIDYRYDVDILDDFKGYCDTLVIDMGLPASIMDLNVILDPTPNAFTVLTPKGFAICLNSGLLECLEYDYFRVMAVVAHEFAHGALFHHLRNEYEVAKKERRDKIVGGIAAGLTAISAGVDAYTAGVTGSPYDASIYSNRIEDIKNDMVISSIKFRYKYGTLPNFRG